LSKDGKATANMNRYLGVQKPENRKNLREDKQALSKTLEPRCFPRGGWPAPGRHPLVLLQQSAVNVVATELKANGIAAVNGPPGTGKTTLLRDVVAHVVTDRAKQMVDYADPEKAFAPSGEKIKRGQAFIHLYRLENKLRGFEMVVASSNNKAVENVSAELPGVQAIAEDGNLRYFKVASDALLERDTWGLIAAVLGNAKNRSSFRQTFWWDKDVGLQTYLQRACGNPQMLPCEDQAGTAKERLPKIIELENPPENKDEALRRWAKVRQEFKNLFAKTENALAELQKANDLAHKIWITEDAIHLLKNQAEVLSQQQKELEPTFEQAMQNFEKDNSAYQETLESERKFQKTKPGFFSRLFRTAAYKAWKAKHGTLREICKIAANTAQHSKKLLDEITANIQEIQRQQEHLIKQLNEQEHTLTSSRLSYEQISSCHPDACFIDRNFFSQGHEPCQKSAPWLDKQTARLRQDLFESALAVHKAFIDCAAKPVRHNLNALMDGFVGGASLGTAERDAIIPDLWATLFLIVPVVSTTFASVSRMFNKLGPEALGWLLIDEAGQAIPQAAVGALMRTQKAVIVGDPIQIEPVVTLPETLTEAICRQFSIDPLIYNAPVASAQTLADSATGYFGSFETAQGTREVGIPLLVHRRCADPMFSISNAVAYERLMVQAKAPKISPIIEALGTSRWIHIEGGGQDKWCSQEGEIVLQMLTALKQKGCPPDLYIVTPFVVVQNKLRDVIRTSGVLENWVDNPWQWVFDRIGTVHTVQGREAEAVIFVLGAPNAEQTGARNWAGGRPNLLNVAITRAKEAVYVVGNEQLWQKAGCFERLANGLK
jgi:AAA domain